MATELTKQEALKQDSAFSVRQNDNGDWAVIGESSGYEYGVFPEKEGADAFLSEMEADQHIEQLAASLITADNFDDSKHFLCEGMKLSPNTVRLAEALADKLGVSGLYPVTMFVGLVAFTLCVFQKEGRPAREGFLRSVVTNRSKLNTFLSAVEAGLPTLDFIPTLENSKMNSAAKRIQIQSATETALIKGSESYQWFEYTGAKPYNLDFRGKPVALKKGDVFGVRWSSNGKQRRLIIESLGESKVFTLTDEDNRHLAKNSKEVATLKSVRAGGVPKWSYDPSAFWDEAKRRGYTLERVGTGSLNALDKHKNIVGQFFHKADHIDGPYGHFDGLATRRNASTVIANAASKQATDLAKLIERRFHVSFRKTNDNNVPDGYLGLCASDLPGSSTRSLLEDEGFTRDTVPKWWNHNNGLRCFLANQGDSFKLWIVYPE